MDGSNVKKLSVSGLLCALAVVGSMFSFPVLGSKCAPVQHMINVLCGIVYHKSKKVFPTLLAEVFGTAVIGGLLAYPVAVFIMGKNMKNVVFYAYIIPFFISTFVGTVIAGVLLYSIIKINIFAKLKLENS